MTTLDELIERMQKATEPSWELDSAIAEIIGWHLDKGDHLFPWANPNGDLLEDCPRFTASIDAALTLVPDGWEWLCSNQAPKPHTGRAYVHNRALQFVGIGGMAKNKSYRGFEDTAATAPIALCIAALKARKVTP